MKKSISMLLLSWFVTMSSMVEVNGMEAESSSTVSEQSILEFRIAEGTGYFFNVVTGELLSSVAHASAIKNIRFSSNDCIVFIEFTDGIGCFFDCIKGKHLGIILESSSVEDIQFDCNHAVVFIWFADGSGRFLNIFTEEWLGTIPDASSSVKCIKQVSSDSKIACFEGVDGRSYFWDIASDTLLSMVSYDSSIKNLNFCLNDDKVVGITFEDGTRCHFDSIAGKIL